MSHNSSAQLKSTSSSRDSTNALTLKLSHFMPLSPADQATLDCLTGDEERFPAHTDIVSEGMTLRPVFMIKEGLAIRYRLLPGGGRQIMTFLIPGDLCDYHAFLLTAMDHSIGTLTPVRVAPIPREAMMDMIACNPRISAALMWSAMQEDAMLRERIVSLGRRDGRGRIAYLLCELLWRHQAVRMVEGGRFGLPLTQADLGDTLGLTSVHVNKILQEFRRRGLLTMERKVLNVLDANRLRSIAEFSKDYLQLGGASKEVARYIDRRVALMSMHPGR